MEKISLNGIWDLYYFKQKSADIKNPSELKDMPKIGAEVPGNVELDLSREGILPSDLFMGENIRELKKFEKYEWWYETEFDVPEGAENKKCSLYFGGVDCFAQYWLNGEEIGESDNMLIPVEIDVTGKLLHEKNKLTVRIRSAFEEAMREDFSTYSLYQLSESVRVRKAPHSYGWDIMPRAVTSGIWRDVELRIKSDYEIKQLFCYFTNVSEKKADMHIHFELDAEDTEDMTVRAEAVCGESRIEAEQKFDFKAGRFMIYDIKNPVLWWPYGYGEQALYDTKISFVKAGKEVASEVMKLGIRSVRLDRTDLTDGKNGNFEFLINNTPIMCKGSNWVPLDAFHSRDKSRYKKAFGLVKDIGCNILRCWGGNVYEDKEFYDFCDENGVMIWQDFSMACNVYPQDGEFQRKMKKEADAVIRDRRNHPSIILWSGDNECDESILINGGDPNNNVITRNVLKRAVIDNDSQRPYLPSSPYLSEAMIASGSREGMSEEHLWGPRDYYKSSFYTKSKCHFVSETGYHGCPSLKSIERFIDKDYIWPIYNNPQWNLHSTDMNGRDERVMLMEKQVRQLFGKMPDNIEDFIFASQVSQAEAKKFFIENIRVHRETKKGIIWWNLLDGWPQMSDAVVDYYFEKKLAYDYIKRSQQPFAIMCGELDAWNIPVIAANDTLTEKRGKYTVRDVASDKLLLSGDFAVRPNSNDELGKIPVMYSEKGMLLIEWEIDKKHFVNHYLYGMPGFELEEYKKWFEKIK